jgi:hypothetical protein
LIEIVYNELCKNKAVTDCRNNLSKYLRVLDVENFVNEETFIKSLIEDRIISRLMQTKVISVLIDKELLPETITQIKNLNIF